MRRSFNRRLLTFTIVAAAVTALAAGGVLRAAAQTPAQASLKIVVIEGEDAVNIIQQKTAVAPIVEVRDRNDLPIAGVPVTFTIAGGKSASFAGGLQQVTVTTNAAGRAAVTGLNPLGAGSYQINVTAAYQGQTAAATITQTNYATAAQAAEAGKSASQTATQASTGAAGGGGGGLSGLAIAGIAGGAAAGGLAAYTLTRTEDCVFSLSSAPASVGGNANSINLTISVSPPDCEPQDWTVNTGSPFVTANPPAGSGNGTVTLSFAANTTGAPRSTTITVRDQVINLTQSPACAFSVSPTAFGSATNRIPSSAQSLTVAVTASPSGCAPSNWSASSNSSFLSVTPTSGSGNASVTVNVSANPANSAERNGTVTIAGQTVTVFQSRGAAPCNQLNVAGFDTPETRVVELGRTSGTFTFSYDTQFQQDRMVVVYEGRTLFDTGCVGTNGTRTQTISYAGNSTQISVQVTPNCAGGFGTVWEFTVSCPR
jgi:hypothetical protein